MTIARLRTRISRDLFELFEAVNEFPVFDAALEHGEAESVNDVLGGFGGEGFIGEALLF